MIQRADHNNIWSYVGIEVWAIPYILLSLENFSTPPSPTKMGYNFHFVLRKARGTKISALWGGSPCSIEKVFSDSGHRVSASDNPYPVTAEAIRQKAGDTSWIREPLLRSLRVFV